MSISPRISQMSLTERPDASMSRLRHLFFQVTSLAKLLFLLFLDRFYSFLLISDGLKFLNQLPVLDVHGWQACEVCKNFFTNFLFSFVYGISFSHHNVSIKRLGEADDSWNKKKCLCSVLFSLRIIITYY